MNQTLRILLLLCNILCFPLIAHSQNESKESIAKIQEAAAQGKADAQYNLGSMYYDGKNVPLDYKQAVIWYRKAAEQGDAYAQVNLGSMYKNGLGVPQDYKLSYAWFSVAATSGMNDAVHNRDTVSTHLNSIQLAEAQELANQFFNKQKKQ